MKSALYIMVVARNCRKKKNLTSMLGFIHAMFRDHTNKLANPSLDRQLFVQPTLISVT